jgi:hypothetical protein
MASGAMSPQRHTLIAHVKTLINQDLREICRQEGLPVSGIKSQLQTRVIDCKFISAVESGKADKLPINSDQPLRPDQ